MAWIPISGIVPQFTESGNQANGYVIKFYGPGTTTPLAVATDNTGGTTATNFLLNTEGYATNSGNIIVPHVEQNYKLALYLNQADADADATDSAEYIIDNLKGTTVSSGSITLADMATIPDGSFIMGNTVGNSYVSMTGNGSLSNGGVLQVTSVQANAIDQAGMQDDSVGADEIIDGSVGNDELASAVSDRLGPILISTTTPTAVGNIDLTLDTGTYSDFIIEIRGVFATVDAELYAIFGHTSGTVFYNTAADYRQSYHNAYAGQTFASTAQIELTGGDNVDQAGGGAFTGTLALYDVSSTLTPYSCEWVCNFKPDGAITANAIAGTAVLYKDQTDTGTNPQIDTVRLTWDSGNFTANGTIKLYGTPL